MGEGMITLRPYQEDIVNRTRASLAKHKSTLIVLQTGGGKTQIASYIAKGAHSRGKSVMFGCHRDFLIEQTSNTFLSHDIPHTFIAAGEKYYQKETACIASIDTLKSRIGRYPAPDIFIVDEAIHAGAKGWSEVINHLKSQGTLLIGLAACPQRNDGVGLGRWFNDMVIGPSMRDLIDMGYLSDYKMYAPSGIDRSLLHSLAGEFKTDEAEAAMSKPHITGCAVNEYMKFAGGKQGVAFCVSIKHSHDVAKAFCDAGIICTHIGSDTSKSDRREMLRDFQNGKIKFLTSVDIFSEGFDLPVVEYAALMRPTKSLNIYRQQIGRVLRKADGKLLAHIADHASNHQDHGFPDDHIEWTLADREKRTGKKGTDEKDISFRICPQCHFAHKPKPSCPECNFIYPIESRKIEEVEGELQEIQRNQEKRQARIRQGMAQTMDDLMDIAEEKKHSKFWVKKMCLIKSIPFDEVKFKLWLQGIREKNENN